MNTNPIREDASGDAGRYSHLFLIVAALFITCLITANIVSVKLVNLFGWVLPAGVLIFPVSYIVGDLLTEVYGYKTARRVIWLGFFCNLIVVLGIWLGKVLPPASFWQGQAAYDLILGYTPRLLAASFLAYLLGEFLNAFVMAKMKVATKGRWLWARTIGSTLVGEGVDSFIFISLAFGGVIPLNSLARAIVTQWIFKSCYEAAATPVTYLAVRTLKQREGLDVFDFNTRFNPLSFKK
jgi:uncharacterized integral membrane protein (TIGR00697 family)